MALIIKLSISCKPKITTKGERSNPENKTNGILLRINANTGSVSLLSTCTIGLYGSGRTKLSSEEIMIIQIYRLMTVCRVCTNA